MTLHNLSLYTGLPVWVIMIAALVAAIFGVGRLSRIAVYDDFPPAAKLRAFWDKVTDDGPWSKLAHCYWCSTPWIMAFALVWFVIALNVTWLMIAWFVFWGWLAVSYIATIVIAYDEPAQGE